MLQLKMVDRVVTDPCCSLREGYVGSDIICITIVARAQIMESKRIACQGRPATTDEKYHLTGEVKSIFENAY